MTLRVVLQHSTHYQFDRPVTLSPHFIRLKPSPHSRVAPDAYSLQIDGGPHFINWQQDPFGNHAARVVFPDKVTELRVAVELIVPMVVVNPFDFFLESYAEQFPFSYPAALKKDLGPYLEITERGPLLEQWVAQIETHPRPMAEFLVSINQRLVQDLEYLVRMEPGIQSPEQTLKEARGSCRDSAWLMVQIMRHLGLAARFVSGYLIQLTADEAAVDGPSGTDVDFTDLHAWAEVFVPGAGWIGLDTTSGLFAGEGHIPLAATPEPGTAAPISGTSSPCEVRLEHDMSVTRLHDAPRVTSPYTEAQWQDILTLGGTVDKALAGQDLTLSTGGKTTFAFQETPELDAPPLADYLLARDALLDLDMGTLQVDIRPQTRWLELVAETEGLYSEARQNRLRAETFRLDGRHTGTGSGDITLGGETMETSPFMQRPDLLASLITYWQHHPSLSFCFTGLFMGPDSSAPRADETNPNRLNDLASALQALHQGQASGSRINALLGPLLTSRDGDPHRTEFDLTQLCPQHQPTERRGLLTLRGFEMPPNARLHLVQTLLLRALVARLAQAPYARPLVSWGPALRDRWLLPHCLWTDLEDIVRDLQAHGIDFQAEWLAPFLEFHFPRCGKVQYGDVTIALRQALEPWHLAQQFGAGSDHSQFLDTSIERLQVTVTGLTPGRHLVTCNGRALPLHETGTSGEAVAGVRYRAWPAAGDEQMTVDAPLVFDLVDTWNERSLGGCTYHVADPAGRNHQRAPVNANAAEARRLARFWPHGHTQGGLTVTPAEPKGATPYTLDLQDTQHA
ncbi:MAG: transglutaminase family protein [Natronospirillum sp.]|uniref:transglutaminase family protein n=1 Tax=Natronospirillum sp. TaxID=2812955 RepID=UPI0025D027C1|nr:transglutaminase family protein [Natronospirillum sp.]MCH8552979.1 transglutaminase family protein [Natronospirillum sp.]